MKMINYIWRYWVIPIGIAGSVVAFLDHDSQSGILLLLILLTGTIIKLLYSKD